MNLYLQRKVPSLSCIEAANFQIESVDLRSKPNQGIVFFQMIFKKQSL